MTVFGDSFRTEHRDQVLLLAGRDPLAAELQHGLVSQCGVGVSSNILVGFSGGADSTALLVLMKALSMRANSPIGRISAFHVDHGLRDDSAEDAAHVAEVCRVLDIELDFCRLSLSGGEGNVSERARVARYEVLEAAAVRGRCEFVCTAHHAEDRFETMLQNLCRGGGASAIGQPRWVRPLGAVGLIRPLLGCSRSDLRTLCIRGEVAFLDDPSNEDPASARGFLRQHVLPALEERWPGASRRASAAADRVFAASEALATQIEDCFGSRDHHSWSRAAFRGVDLEIAAAAIRRSVLHIALAGQVEVEQNAFAQRLREAAEYASSERDEPRVFEFARGKIKLLVHANEVGLTRSEG